MAIPTLGQFITADLDDIDLPVDSLSSFGWLPMDPGVLLDDDTIRITPVYPLGQ